MQQQLQLWELRVGEPRVLRAKLRTQSPSVRMHQRNRITAEVRHSRSAAAVAERVACALVTDYHCVHRFNASGVTIFERPPNLKNREPSAHV